MTDFILNQEIDNNDGTFTMLVSGTISYSTANAWQSIADFNVNLPNIDNVVNAIGFYNYNGSFGINVNTFYKTNASSELGECLKIVQNGNRIGARIISRNTDQKQYEVAITYTKQKYTLNISGDYNITLKVDDVEVESPFVKTVVIGNETVIDCEFSDGYEFDKINIDNVDTEDVLPLTLTQDNKNHTISITSKEIPEENE